MMELTIADLTCTSPVNPMNFSISTDASKMIQVSLQYFSVDSGNNKKLLNFVEQNDETSDEFVIIIGSHVPRCHAAV